MKKLILSTLCLLALSVYPRTAMNYLIQQGGGSGATWTRSLSANDSVVDLTVAGQTLTGWLASRTSWASADQVWVAAGTYSVASYYNIGTSPSLSTAYPSAIYGGFAGTEASLTERAKGSNAWNYTSETIINGASSSTGIFNAGADRTMTIDGITFTGCVSSSGQALYQRPNMTVQNCKFTANACVALRYYISSASKTASVLNSYFYNNNYSLTAGAEGGCITANNASSGGTYTISGCTFDSNSSVATGAGATAGVKGQGAGNVVISQCIFKNNNATAGNSSAVSLTSSTCSLVNSLVYGTSVATNKPALYITAGSAINNTVVNNLGGAAYLSNASTSTISLINNVFWGEDAKSGQITAVASCLGTITNCAYTSLTTNFIGTVANTVDLTTTSTGVFVDPASNNWSLAVGSPLINMGTSTSAPTVDILGTSRPQGGSMDIGAYERSITTGLETVSVLKYQVANQSVTFNDLKAGETVRIFTLQGVQVSAQKAISATMTISLNKGVYLIKTSASAAKVMIY